jgi:signal transduction histidine kinase
MPTFLEDIKAYVGFGAEEAATLGSLVSVIEPHFEWITDHFYERILDHPRAHAAITGGTAQVERLKGSLRAWMDLGLRGPHDEAFYERRARIGRIHVQIGLPQQYMVTAINVMRLDVRKVLEDALQQDWERYTAASRAIDKLFDIELAIMLQTYRIDSEERLRRRERLATIGQLAASIGHDLRNPLGVIESSLFIMRRRIGEDERAARHLEKIAKQVQTCDRIVTDLLDMARNNPPKLAPIDIEGAFQDALSAAPLPSSVTVHRSVDPECRLIADPGLLQQALVNLLNNALRAIENEGTIELRAEPAQDDCVSLTVSDDGPGFDPAVLPMAFEPLISTREKGVGLGLALVKSVAERHGGQALAENLPGGGARVQMLLPREPNGAGEPPAEPEVGAWEKMV